MIHLDDLRLLGLTDTAVRKRAATGRLHRRFRAVYSIVPVPLLNARGHWRAAVLACGPGAVLSHRSAAALHELRSTDRARIDVTVPGTSESRRHAGIDLHRSTTLTPDDVTVVEAIQVTTIARTTFDLAGVLSRRQTDWTLNQAEVSGRLDLAALWGQIERNAHTRAARRLREALALYRPGDRPTESPLEDAFVELIRAAGLPEPERQVTLDLDDGEGPIRPDFVWRSRRLIVEVDGASYHRTRRAFEDDRRRDQRLLQAGWIVVRFTHRQLSDEPGAVIALVAQLLGVA